MSEANTCTSPSKSRHHSYRWHLDLDHYLNPFLPNPPWRWLPRPVSHVLGYREHPVQIMGNVLIAFWSLVGCFCSIALVSAVSMHIPAFQAHGASVIVASFGAAAVLQFSAIESPLAQPRNAIFGQLIASVIGAAISKLFDLSPHTRAFPEIGGALACGITTALMVLTHTVHPPAGATALLAVSSTPQLGWFLIPVVMLECCLMIATALIINNIQRRYPMYWWTAHDLRPRTEDAERKEGAIIPNQCEEGLTDDVPHIIIRRGEMFMSDGIVLTEEEQEILERITNRI